MKICKRSHDARVYGDTRMIRYERQAGIKYQKVMIPGMQVPPLEFVKRYVLNNLPPRELGCYARARAPEQKKKISLVYYNHKLGAQINTNGGLYYNVCI
ncbi:unnamed protein product [Trichogramma brassicae]|uniref:Uncharacterized protein n=1 Tax=Trichogramma brassicae TaxID=86971 RepID=A0A6H5J530_9HYME|nr:unnamed protein product [Trichogramma brassicae]